MTAGVRVRVLHCGCPDQPHDGHHVFMRPTLTLEGGLAAEQDRADMIEKHGPADPRAWTPTEIELVGNAISRRWFVTFVRYGATGWDLCDGDGNPRPFDVEALLDDYSLAKPVAEKGNELYGEAVLAPLRAVQHERSPTGPMESSTSATPTPIRKRSKRSSRARSAASRQSVA